MPPVTTSMLFKYTKVPAFLSVTRNEVSRLLKRSMCTINQLVKNLLLDTCKILVNFIAMLYVFKLAMYYFTAFNCIA